MTAWRLTAIVSDATPGAARGGLDAAIELDLGNGGWRANGDEPPAIYAERMRATSSTNRGIARRLNVQDSDGTLIVSFRPKLAGVAAFVAEHAEQQRKAYLHVVLPDGDRSKMPEQVAREVREWIREAPISILNVAGPTEEEEPGIQEATRDALVWIFEDEVDAMDRGVTFATVEGALPVVELPTLIKCPCGCGLLTTGTTRCGRCDRDVSNAHWDGLHDSCGECADRLGA